MGSENYSGMKIPRCNIRTGSSPVSGTNLFIDSVVMNLYKTIIHILNQRSQVEGSTTIERIVRHACNACA